MTKKRALNSNPPLPGIESIIVLMFENRSFDNVLGTLYGLMQEPRPSRW